MKNRQHINIANHFASRQRLSRCTRSLPAIVVVLHLDWPLKKSYDTGDDTTSEGKNMALNYLDLEVFILLGARETQGAAIVDTAAAGELVGIDWRCSRVEWWRAAG